MTYKTLPPIALSMRQVLPAVRKAFDEKNLQAFQTEIDHSKGLYQGPCAIGCALPEITQRTLDASGDYSGIRNLVERGTVVVPDGEIGDLERLQNAHDGAVPTRHRLDYHDDTLQHLELVISELEEKYGVQR